MPCSMMVLCWSVAQRTQVGGEGKAESFLAGKSRPEHTHLLLLSLLLTTPSQ